MRRQSAIPKFARGPWLPVFVCLGLNFAVLAGIYGDNPSYLTDYETNKAPDARHYVLLGRNLLLHGDYSRCSEAPYHPDILRPPGYPLFAGALEIAGGPAAIYVVQALLHSFAVFCLFSLVQRFIGPGAAFWSSMFLATDPLLVTSNFEALSEPLFLFLIVASACWIMPAVLNESWAIAQVKALFVGGLLLAAALMTRAAGLYLPFIYAGASVIAAWKGRSLAGMLLPLAVFLGITLAPVAGWIARNHAVLSVNHFTTGDAVVMVYFMGAGAYQVEHSISLEEAQARISAEFKLPDAEVAHNHWIGERPVAELDRELRSAIFPVLTKYPRALIVSSAVGVAKASTAHKVGALAHMLGRNWQSPGRDQLLRGDRQALDRLVGNGPLLLAAFCWQMLHTLAALALAGLGVIAALRNRQALGFVLLVLTILAYFGLTVALDGFEATCRNRESHLAFLYVFAGLAASKLLMPSGENRPAAQAVAT